MCLGAISMSPMTKMLPALAVSTWIGGLRVIDSQ
jgi:hypothetical protein